MKKMDINKLFSNASKVTLPAAVTASRANGPMSMSVVNSKDNGKRVAFSKALASVLELDKIVELMPVAEDGAVLVARELPTLEAIRGELKGDGKKLFYSSVAVEYITDVFNLDYNNRTSISFSDIEIDEVDGVPVAVVRIRAAETADDENA